MYCRSAGATTDDKPAEPKYRDGLLRASRGAAHRGNHAAPHTFRIPTKGLLESWGDTSRRNELVQARVGEASKRGQQDFREVRSGELSKQRWVRETALQC